MNKILNILSSMKFMLLLLIAFAFSLALGTFIENDYGTLTAKSMIYSSYWIAIIMGLLCYSLISNFFTRKLYTKSKITIGLFHIAFVFIIIGGGITRFISYEGLVHIRENQSVNKAVSDDPFISMKIHDYEQQYTWKKQKYFSTYTGKSFKFLSKNKFRKKINFKGNNVDVKYIDFIPNAIDTIVEDPGNKTPILHLVFTGSNGRENHYLKYGEEKVIKSTLFSFGEKRVQGFNIFYVSDTLYFNCNNDVSFFRMLTQEKGDLEKGNNYIFESRILYDLKGIPIVLKDVYLESKIEYVESDLDNIYDLLQIQVSCNSETKQINLFGDVGSVNKDNNFELGGLNFSFSYGSEHIDLPFYLTLDKFVLTKYPGSDNPSSFESYVELIDKDKIMPFHIYMNNILKYKGFRFYQSSYDNDEKGTVLSMNHDFYGTLVSYFGYLILALGFILTLFNSKSRFGLINKKLNKTALLFFCFFSISNLHSQNQKYLVYPSDTVSENKTYLDAVSIDYNHSKKFGSILVQDENGRLKPINTFSSELLRKVYGSDEYYNLSSDQVLLSMSYSPFVWTFFPVIKVKNKDLKYMIDSSYNDNYFSYMQFFGSNKEFLFKKSLDEAFNKKPASRTKFDQAVISVTEKVQIYEMMLSMKFLNIFPIPNDVDNKWISSNDSVGYFSSVDSLFVKNILPIYFENISQGLNNNNWSSADSILSFIRDYQVKFGKDVYLSENKIRSEILYNKMDVFNNLYKIYALLGLLYLSFAFISLLNNAIIFKRIINVFYAFSFVLFLIHLLGLILRWYVSGHAPWSDAYESMIFISWTAILAGLIFSKKSHFSFAAGLIVSAILLSVAHLNWVDPEITNLVPVLKSYWLMIHVAIITSSYGFLALGAVLGIINLISLIFNISRNNIMRLTYINESTLTVGVILLTIGTFLGGVWANESWGRYWGWDPKETWALISILVYAFILHTRFIPNLNNVFIFNLISIIGFFSIIMTYFGVNYYLSGLHSYAKGDPLPIPDFLYYSIFILFCISVLSYFMYKKNFLNANSK